MKNLSHKEFCFALTGARRVFGGIAGSNLNVMRALIELAEERRTGLTVFSYLEKDGDRPYFAPAWVRFRGFEGNKTRFASSLLRIASTRPAVVFDHVTLALPLLPFAAVGWVKTVIFAHGSESWKRLRRTSRWSFQSAVLCLANSYFTLKKIGERFSGLNVVACPLGLSPEFVLNKEIPEGIEDPIELEAADGRIRILGRKCLLLVARMHPREGLKGHRALINIMPALLNSFPDVQLVFPGPGEGHHGLRASATSRGVSSAVFFPGFLSVEDLTRLYQHCYAFVMPSQQEGFGLAYLEAMNYAKPCVGCYDQGAEDIIVNGETGFLIHDPNNARELTETLVSLLRDPERAQELGRKGFERLHQYFTANHYQQRVKKEISRVL